MNDMEIACREIVALAKKKNITDQNKFQTVKKEIAKKYKTKKIPTNIEISLNISATERNKMKHLISIKPARELSGVTVVAIMTKPLQCPHEKCGIGPCAMCPGGPKSDFGEVPQSYTGREPATKRAIRNNFDPYLQVFNRLEQYVAMSRVPDKVELIIMGGTFPSYRKNYQEEFVKFAFKGMNDFGRMFFPDGKFDLKKYKDFFELPGDLNNPEREKKVLDKILKIKRTCELSREQKKNEKSLVRCVGLTIETRPDYAMKKHANQMLALGCTRVELGVQSIYDDVLKSINRGHGVKETIKSTQILRDLGFKINYHMMPGLPKMDYRREIESFKELFNDSRFKPDMLKLYPCMVMKGTKLYKMWKSGKFKPLTTTKAANLISEFKKYIPSWVRVMRVQRDIPTFMVEGGVDRTNLRQYIMKDCDIKGVVCQCIRCREIKNEEIGKVELITTSYEASKGQEFFIEARTNNKLLGFARARFPGKSIRDEISIESVLVRELHVYGSKIAIGKKGGKGKVQHRGIGKELMAKVEYISKLNRKKKVVVISAIGTREYYRKLGYRLQGPYMVKKL